MTDSNEKIIFFTSLAAANVMVLAFAIKEVILEQRYDDAIMYILCSALVVALCFVVATLIKMIKNEDSNN